MRLQYMSKRKSDNADMQRNASRYSDSILGLNATRLALYVYT